MTFSFTKLRNFGAYVQTHGKNVNYNYIYLMSKLQQYQIYIKVWIAHFKLF